MTGVSAAFTPPAALRTPALDVGWVLAAAIAAAAGALLAVPVPPWPALAVVAAGLVRPRPLLIVAGVGLAASGLAAAAWSGLAPPPARPVAEWGTLVGDPRAVGSGMRVDVRVADGSRHRAWAYGAPAYRLADRLSGERVFIRGRLRPPSDQQRRWFAARHLAGVIDVEDVDQWSPGDALTRLANGIRRHLARGASGLGERDRALLAGLTVGDDRDIPPATQADFRAAGLTHLLAVSGQNVAFVLALAGPLVGRRGLRARLVVLAVVLVVFGTITRWEPSVLRASVMAAVALGGTTGGRAVRGLRPLALTVAVLLLVDPLLVHSVGFLLSVGASAGIATLARPIAARLPGPRFVAEPLAVTVAAQVGVAPALIGVFGWLPVASLPANLLAGPTAGPAMSWGVVGGLVAGVVGGPVAWAVQVPTRLCVGWIAGVARVTSAVPGEVGQPVVLVGLVVALVAFAAPRVRTSALLVAAVLVLAGPAVDRPPDLHDAEVARGARLWRTGPHAVLVVDGADPIDLVSSLRRHRVGRLRVVVLSRRRDAAALAPLVERVGVEVVVAPGTSPADGVVDPGSGWSTTVGPWKLDTRRVGTRVEAEVSTAGAGATPLPSPNDAARSP